CLDRGFRPAPALGLGLLALLNLPMETSAVDRGQAEPGLLEADLLHQLAALFRGLRLVIVVDEQRQASEPVNVGGQVLLRHGRLPDPPPPGPRETVPGPAVRVRQGRRPSGLYLVRRRQRRRRGLFVAPLPQVSRLRRWSWHSVNLPTRTRKNR